MPRWTHAAAGFGLLSVFVGLLAVSFNNSATDKLVLRMLSCLASSGWSMTVNLLAPWTRRNVPYLHLDTSKPLTNLKPNSKVLHVAKEFGPATMGGLGTMLSALVSAQAIFSSSIRPAVIIPHYAFLRQGQQTELVANVTIPVRTSYRRKSTLVVVPISRMTWSMQRDDTMAPHDRSDEAIDVFLVGPGDQRPFHVAFHATDPGQIYSAIKPLKQEWKDLFFAKAVAAFVESSPADQKFDVVHLHGATNALVTQFLGPQSTQAIVYTLHDSLDEVEYSNLLSNFEHFDDVIDSSAVARYVHGRRLYTSALGIDSSDVTTFVSRTIARAMVEGTFDFALQELVMPSIYEKAAQGTFVGVSNGLDLSDSRKNPFTSSILHAHGVAFPHDLAAEGTTSFQRAKATSKRIVSSQVDRLASEAQDELPWLLFVGRFQYNKGCQFFEPLVEHLAALDRHHSAKLVALGAHNNYPRQELRRLAQRHPRHFALLDDGDEFQDRYGALIRMASDISFVPSFSEAFGLVAAEGLLFGMPVLTTGVGGLSEFVQPFGKQFAHGRTEPPSHDRQGNAYLFDLDLDLGKQSFGFSLEYARPNMTRLQGAVRSLISSVDEAIDDWHGRRRRQAHHAQDINTNEQFVRRMVQSALRLAWDRPGGPVEEVRFLSKSLIAKAERIQYDHVYDLSVRNAEVRKGKRLKN